MGRSLSAVPVQLAARVAALRPSTPVSFHPDPDEADCLAQADQKGDPSG
jgi:hypothetical protein